MNSSSPFTNALKFEAILCAAAEILPYAKDEFIQAGMDAVKHLPRDKRREEERSFKDGFANLQRILTTFSKVVERDNPEFFDRVVDTLVENVNNPNIVKW